MFKLIKWSALTVCGVAIVGTLVFGTDIFSYAGSSYKRLKENVKSAVPMEFEIQRARDLLSDLLPELQANVVTVAKEEVEVEELEKEISEQTKALEKAKTNVAWLRKQIEIQPVVYTASGGERKEKIQTLAREVEDLKLEEKLLEGKEKILTARKRSLNAAIQSLKEAQLRKVKLEAQIENLEHEIRLVKMQSHSPHINVDRSSLVKAEKLVNTLKKRLTVAQKIMTREIHLPAPTVEEKSEKELLCSIDSYLGKKERQAVEPELAVQDNTPAE